MVREDVSANVSHSEGGRLTAQIIPLRKREPKYVPFVDKNGKEVPNFLVYTKTGVIHFRKQFRKLGIPSIFKSTGETTIGRARTAAELMEQRHKNKHLGVDDSSVFGRAKVGRTFSVVSDWVLENYTPTQRTRTQDNHKLYIGQLAEILGPRDIQSIDQDTLAEVIREVKAKKRYSKKGKLLPTRTTFVDYAKNLSLVMRIAYERKWVSHLLSFKDPDAKKETGRLLTRTECEALWEAFSETHRDMYVLALECVMREREGLCAPWSELNLETGVWTLPPERVKTGSKTGKGRAFKLSPRALARLKARYAKRKGDSPWIFPSRFDKSKPTWSIKTAWASAKVKAGIKGKCRWHDLRHTGLTWMILGDPDATPEVNAKMIRPIEKVSAYCGTSIKTLERVYLKKRAKHTEEVAGAIDLGFEGKA